MAYEDQPRSLVDQRPEIVVHVPAAEERPETPPIIVEDRPVQWFERSEAPWVVLGVAVVLIALLLLLGPETITVSAAPKGGRPATSVDRSSPPWAAITLPVPEDLRTHTVNVAGGVDVIQVASLGPGTAGSLVGSVATADGPAVQQVFDDHAFSLASPAGGTVVAFLPYQAGDALIVDPGTEVTFIGTLMPVPPDFDAMVGAEAASIATLTGVYVRVVPETLRIVTTP